MRVQAIVFDWGGVLTGNIASGIGEFERRVGVAAGTLPTLMGMHPIATDPTNLWHQRELGQATALEWATWYCDRLHAAGGLKLQPEQFVAGEVERFGAMNRNDVVIEAARRWKAAGYRLGICTNNFAEVGAAWRGQLPMELFDAVVASCEVGVRKPDPEMYEHVTRVLGVRPEATVLLDDFEGNVEGARAVGWQAVRVDVDHAAAIAEVDALLDASNR